METAGEATPRFRSVAIDLPGMDTALRHVPAEDSRPDASMVLRCGPNRWALELEGLAAARLELDRCGSWVSIGTGAPPPVLVRRAGWIDVRGQRGTPSGGPGGPAFDHDRVGLGPGDALAYASAAVTGARDTAGEAFADESMLETLLGSAGQPAAILADRLLDAAATHVGGTLAPDAAVLIVRVPDDAEEDPDARLRAALGPHHRTALPGYPVGLPHRGADRPPAPPREARILLAPVNSAVPASRRFTTGVLHSWRLSGLADEGDVELITSELVGNAVRHGDREITVLVRYDGTRVRVAVGDGSRALPRSRRAGEGDVDGRGLLIVDTLAVGFGVSRTVGGKRVWAEVDAPPADTA